MRAATLFATTFLLAGTVSPALADRDGAKVEVKDDGREYKYEYKGHGCKYEYKHDRLTGEVKVEEKGNCRALIPAEFYRPQIVSVPAPVVGVPPRVPAGPVLPTLACDRELVGRLAGGALGGLIGSQIGDGSGQVAATIAGVAAGFLLGGAVGQGMDQTDQACAGRVLEVAPADETIRWQNPDTGVFYGVTPGQPVERAEGVFCRPFSANAVVEGRTQVMSGTACRRTDGTWEVVSG